MTRVTQDRHHTTLRSLMPGLAIFLTLYCSGVLAFENLTEAQTLVYDTPHLANTKSGQTINYTYAADTTPTDQATDTDSGELSDNVVLSVLKAHADNKRDVSIEFLSGKHRLPLPDFKEYRGNPVIIAMLEHIAVSMGRDTGGGTIYFRNRIKDGLAAENLEISTVPVKHSDQTVDARQFSFSPFTNDSYLVERPNYTSSVFTITLSDEVPGGVVALSVSSAETVENAFQHHLTLD